MTPEYTFLSIASVVIVLLAERFGFRTGLFRQKAFWIGYAICLFFQVLVDGWLTKLSDPVVIYDDKFNSGVRFPWDIPVEDYFFGFSLISLALLLWVKSGRSKDGSSGVSSQL